MFTWFLAGWAEGRLLRRRLKQVCHDSMGVEQTIRLLGAVEYSLHSSRPKILASVSAILRDSKEQRDFVRLIVVKFLLDRITSSPLSILKLAKTDPVLAGPDIAALYRSMFEAAINLLYLIDDPDYSKLASYYVAAFDAEKKMYESMSKWRSHSDEWISRYADRQSQVQDGPTDSSRCEMLTILGCADPAKYPNIFERSKRIGPTWEFLYDAMYRGLSAWQHGDMSRGHISSSLLLLMPEYAERTVFETMIVVMWTWELTYHVSIALFKFGRQLDAFEDIQKLHYLCNALARDCLTAAQQKFQFARSQESEVCNDIEVQLKA